ncbi:hypothetical protein B0H14DRAFT_3558422, partial [Mycena olivaceomarginata]
IIGSTARPQCRLASFSVSSLLSLTFVFIHRSFSFHPRMNFLRLLRWRSPAQFLQSYRPTPSTTPVRWSTTIRACTAVPAPTSSRTTALTPAQLSNGTFSAFENNGGNFVGTQDTGLRLRFNGTAIYVYLAVPAAANLSTPVHCSFILDSVPDAGGDFSMNGPPVVNQYNVLAYAKTDIPDGSHILNMDVETPQWFSIMRITRALNPAFCSVSIVKQLRARLACAVGCVKFWQYRAISFLVTSSAASKVPAALTSSPSLSLNPSAPLVYIRCHDDIRRSDDIFCNHLDFFQSQEDAIYSLASSAAAVGVALILALFVGFMLYHRARTHQSRCAGHGGLGSVPILVIQDHRGTASAAQMQQNQSKRNEVPLRQLRKEVKRLEGTSNGAGSDIASLVSTSMEGRSAKGLESASRARFAFHDEEGPDARSAGS